MSSDVQSALAVLQLNDYISLIIATAVTYDYCLTFSKEVVTFEQTLDEGVYVVSSDSLRGLSYCPNVCWVLTSNAFRSTASFGGSTFVPGPVKVRHSLSLSHHTLKRAMQMFPTILDSKIGYIQGTAIDVIARWSYVIFWVGADMAMILRVYAIYDRSRIILGALLVMYIAQLVIFFIGASIYSDSKYSTVSTVQLLNLTICTFVVSTQTWNIAAATIQCILASVLCILVVVKFARNSVQMYQATRTWQLNRYISLLTRDGLFYFLAYVSVSFLSHWNNELTEQHTMGNNIQGLGLLLPSVFANVFLFNLTPRFVINVRELYVLDLQGRWDVDIDTGFGLSSRAGHGVGQSTTIGTIAFVEGGVTSELEDVEERVTGEERVEGGNRQVLVV
ncbi:hypothetical protein L210DRAFT_3499625 [Boletus edulis BED1]|uniref:Transmembrane protein n=1 Tax=Boletus edulis BED1 TaxID=1328754 RepID=A0AAD4GMI6_BOLED|nr:hypothetical protein L210DRAFT_3499625 [Boletus edulis BED1]